MKHGYAWEKLYMTVRILAASDQRLQERLAAAWVHSGIRLSYGVAPDLPEDLQAEYNAIHDALTKVQDPDQGSVNATCAALSTDEASELVQRIVSLYDSVCREYYRSWK
ncbi:MULTISPECIES: hypothetical protein [Sorangium]|uniref:Uncharacterized protein n=1 Tax=Sorangium cellulosum TaxID=56 RepID=A0A4V0NF23_SORCE|nr:MULTISPECIES: hypothetical protein [Sorangium]AUX28172.1 uncharacterized protein SOCE836_002400 [Sorangium cellulosum]WCQ87573.1 hypothetical protein NQZ70_00236 [Sorangium sp. Soce836]